MPAQRVGVPGRCSHPVNQQIPTETSIVREAGVSQTTWPHTTDVLVGERCIRFLLLL